MSYKLKINDNLIFLSTDSAIDLDQLHILSHLGIQICNVRFDELKKKFPYDFNTKSNTVIFDVAFLYVKSQRYCSKLNAEDPVQMEDWLLFTENYSYIAANVFE